MTDALSKKISELPAATPPLAGMLPWADPNDLSETKRAVFGDIYDIAFGTDDGSDDASIRQRAGHVLNVVDDFGAVGDFKPSTLSGTDDTAALAAAFAAAIATGKPLYVPKATFWTTATLPAVTAGFHLFGPGNIVLYSPEDPGLSTILWLGDPSKDPEEGGNPRPPGQPLGIKIDDLTFTCLNDLWSAVEILGPFDGDDTSWAPTFSAVVTERHSVQMFVDGEPYPAWLQTVTDLGTDTPTFSVAAAPGATVWFARWDERAWAIQNQGTTAASIQRCRFNNFGGWCREGYKQRNNGTRYSEINFGCYRLTFPGCRVVPAGAQEANPDEEGPTLRPQPAFVSIEPNEAVDGSRTSFTFTLPTLSDSGNPATGLEPTQLLGVEVLHAVVADDVTICALDYDTSGWGSGTIAVEMDAPPATTLFLRHYTIPIGSPFPLEAIRNSGPMWHENCQIVGSAGNYVASGPFADVSPDNGYPPAMASEGGATADTKFWINCSSQSFWGPFASSTGWDIASPTPTPDGMEDTFTFVFTDIVQPRTFRIFVNGVNWIGQEGATLEIVGEGTDTIVATLGGAPLPGAEDEVEARRYFPVDPIGRGEAFKFDYTKAHPSNTVIQGGFYDHTTHAALWWFTEPEDPPELRSFTRVFFVNNVRFSVDMNQGILVDAQSDQPCAALLFDNLTFVSRRGQEGEHIIWLKGNYSSVSFGNVYIGELGSPVLFPDRVSLARFDGEVPKITGMFGGKLAGREERALASVPIEITNPFVTSASIVGVRFPSGDRGFSSLLQLPDYISATLNLDPDPLLVLELPDGSGFNNNLRIVIPEGAMQAGDIFVMSGATSGNGLDADFLNREWVVYRIDNLGRAVITMGRYFEGESPITSAGAFGGSSVVLEVHKQGLIRLLHEDSDIIATEDLSSTVTIEVPEHGALLGQTVFLEVQSAVGGISTGNLNGARRIIGIPDADHIQVQAGAAASSTDPDGGGDCVVTFWVPASWYQNWQVVGCVPSPGPGAEFYERLERAAAQLEDDDQIGVFDKEGRPWRTPLSELASKAVSGLSYTAVGGIPGGRILGRGTNSTGAAEALTATLPLYVTPGGTEVTTRMATSRLLGRSTAGTGVIEELTIGSGLQLVGGELSATSDGDIEFSDLPNVTGPVVLGRDDTTSGSLETLTLTAPLTATGGAVAIRLAGPALLGRDDTTTGGVESLTVTSPFTLSGNSLTTSLTAGRILGRGTNSTGAVEQLTATLPLYVTPGGTEVTTRMATSRMIGRVTAGTGVFEELTAAQVRTFINVEDGAAVPSSRTVSAGTGLTGGGDLSANRTISLSVPISITNGGTGANNSTDALANLAGVPTSRQVATTSPLAGGGSLSSNLTLTTSMATERLLGRVSGGTGVAEELTAAQARTLLATPQVATGTGTPTVFGSTTAGSHTYGTQTMRWTRIGDLVTFSISVAITTKDGSMAGAVRIGSLPYAAAFVSAVSVTVGGTNGLDINTGGGFLGVAAQVNNATDYVQLYEIGDQVNRTVIGAADVGNNCDFIVSGSYFTNASF